ncbi:pirin family protein [bacterium]|nr:pirin family protein [bacterium]
MNTTIHKAGSRGVTRAPWLLSWHTFSFDEYHNAERMGFGALRVLNDDVVQPGHGFEMHSHQNMEIVTIVLSGALEHRDDLGNTSLISAGDVQIMSAGTGITHAEYNPLRDEPVALLQIWVEPEQRDIAPRYEQRQFAAAERRDTLRTIIAPERGGGALWINQRARFLLGSFSRETPVRHAPPAGNGVYVFVIAGTARIGATQLDARDGAALSETPAIDLLPAAGAELLLIDVPMAAARRPRREG